MARLIFVSLLESWLFNIYVGIVMSEQQTLFTHLNHHTLKPYHLNLAYLIAVVVDSSLLEKILYIVWHIDKNIYTSLLKKTLY